jgi:UDP-N-acetylglucosamine--N-acetylmuramyl-(pentapeptide) pyrophosphoryl-undecaprenol N-acetylglucosamine transferase
MSVRRTVVFAGGGTGGHLFPGMAVWSRLRARRPEARAWFRVSERPLDARLLHAHGLEGAPVTMPPLRGAGRLPRFAWCWARETFREMRRLRAQGAAAVLATGGFTCAPVVTAARLLGLPVALLGLDAVPGKAVRVLGPLATRVFLVGGARAPHGAYRVGMPMRVEGLAHPPAEARRAFGMDPARPLLLVTGGSQGAEALNEAMVRASPQLPLAGWQVLHVGAEGKTAERLVAAYERAGARAKAVRFVREMGMAWAAAELAVSRAGAGSAAEARAARVPTVFVPYPHHRDAHQEANAAPLRRAGGAHLAPEGASAEETAAAIRRRLGSLLRGPGQRRAMTQRLGAIAEPDGAEAVAAWLAARLRRPDIVAPRDAE